MSDEGIGLQADPPHAVVGRHTPDHRGEPLHQPACLRHLLSFHAQVDPRGLDPGSWTSSLWGLRCPDRWPTYAATPESPVHRRV